MDPLLKNLNKDSLKLSSFTIGSDIFKIGSKNDSDLQLQSDNNITQCVINKHDGVWSIMSDRLDTRINGFLILPNKITRLHNGDEIQYCGKYVFQFILNDFDSNSKKRKFDAKSDDGFEESKCWETKYVILKKQSTEMRERYQKAIEEKLDTITFLCEQKAQEEEIRMENEKKLKTEIEHLRSKLSTSFEDNNKLSKELQDCKELAENVNKVNAHLQQLLIDSEQKKKVIEEANLAPSLLNQTLMQDLECPICSEVMIKPAITDCKHTFCSHCIVQWLNQKNECVLCKAKITRLYHSLVFDQFIDKFVELIESNDSVQKRRASRAKLEQLELNTDYMRWFENKNHIPPAPLFFPLMDVPLDFTSQLLNEGAFSTTVRRSRLTGRRRSVRNNT